MLYFCSKLLIEPLNVPGNLKLTALKILKAQLIICRTDNKRHIPPPECLVENRKIEKLLLHLFVVNESKITNEMCIFNIFMFFGKRD